MKIDYNNIPKAEAVPEADSMIETFRAIGYTLETAVADIIDNSITAGAKNVWITRIWDGDNSSICIKDDGHGMNSDECIQAMRPGSKNPLEERDAIDLGRFGLGLKTASFSQCRKLTLLSKRKGGKPVAWTWDLDYVGKVKKWEVLQWIPNEYLHIIDDLESGTAVIWSELDRLVTEGTEVDDENARQKFTDSLSVVRKHVAMVFHRFLTAGVFKVFWGEDEIEPWDPFCIKEDKTQAYPDEYISFGNEIVYIKGYVLPHKDEFSSEAAYKAAEGIYGYPAMQGFYVYRGKRMLLAGDWLGLFRKEDHYKLVRIMINLPNTLDTQWQIDIKKSTAIPPITCQEFLRSYAKKVRALGVEVFRHKGRIIQYRAGRKFQNLWQTKKVGNYASLIINRQHAFVVSLKEMAKSDPNKAINLLLTFIEESIPKEAIQINASENEEDYNAPVSKQFEDGLRIMAAKFYKDARKDGTPEQKVKEGLKQIYPYNYYQYIIDELHE